MRILIVEDNAAMRRLLDLAIEGAGTAVGYCSDGDESLAAYLHHQPDIVLMDIAMPRIDGLAATRQILHTDPAAKVVIVTSYDDDLFRAAAAEAGASAYILKRDLLELAALLRSLHTAS